MKYFLGTVVTLIVVAAGVLFISSIAEAGDKVTICHATSSEENPYVQTTVSVNATGGHFDENGTPLAGHEEDLLLDEDENCPGVEEPPVDVCPDLGGVQTDIAECTEEPPTDVCPDMEGVQTDLAECPEPPTDVCPDLEGVQTDLAECPVPPVDVCPDLEGVQLSLEECLIVNPPNGGGGGGTTTPTTTPPTVVEEDNGGGGGGSSRSRRSGSVAGLATSTVAITASQTASSSIPLSSLPYTGFGDTAMLLLQWALILGACAIFSFGATALLFIGYDYTARLIRR